MSCFISLSYSLLIKMFHILVIRFPYLRIWINPRCHEIDVKFRTSKANCIVQPLEDLSLSKISFAYARKRNLSSTTIKIGSKNSDIFSKKKKKILKNLLSFSLRYPAFISTCHKEKRSERSRFSFQSVSPLPSAAISRQVFLFSLNFLPLLALRPLLILVAHTHLYTRAFHSSSLRSSRSVPFTVLRTCRSPAVAFDSIQFFRSSNDSFNEQPFLAIFRRCARLLDIHLPSNRFYF